MMKPIENPECENVEKNYIPTHDVYRKAAHAMFFARTDEKLWDKHPYKALVNMHLRFDGRLGFPGGLIDEGENIETALNREIAEEMGEGNPIVVEKDWMSTQYSSKDKLLMHFYCKEVDRTEFLEIEKRGLSAKEYGVEILGLLRVPLYTRKRNNGGLPMFLENHFAGNARENLLNSLLRKEVLEVNEIEAALCVSKEN
eukprot:GFUD01005216.1.p1 GENE.GFUD01005216.1~~GFUD01005216.1.p1  ORF type:complete len:199 (+),score=46.59 GFUD01005216.1:34-630(+)